MKRDILFGVCTDVHHHADKDEKWRMRAFVKEANERKADFIIQLGDFVLPDESGSQMLKEWEKFNGPRYHVLGNHDTEHGGGKEKMLAFLSQKDNYFSFDVGDYHFIVLDTNYAKVGGEYIDYGSEKNDYRKDFFNCYIPDFELAWLEKDIAATNKRCFIFTHAPSELGDWRIYNTHDFREVLWHANQKAGYNKVSAIFSGHDHADAYLQKGGIHYLLMNSMSHKFIGGIYPAFSYAKAEVEKDYGTLKNIIPYKDPLYAFVRVKANGLVQIIGKQSEYDGNSPLELHWEHFASPQISYREFWLNGHGEL
jgi:predicted phosphodiesterase